MNPFPEYEVNKCIPSSHFSSVSLSDVAAAREELTGEALVIKIIETNQVGGGVNVCYTGDVLTLEEAFGCGLIPASVYVKVLQRQKACQDVKQMGVAGNLWHFGPEEKVNHEVNGLILKCLSGGRSLASERTMNTLGSVWDVLNDHEIRSMPLDSAVRDEDASVADVSEGVDEKLRVDVAVQCDLMNSSSTLIVLGHQQQFMGLVLPLSRETMSSSFQQITNSKYTSQLFSNRGKIAAFYIPESSEIIEITSAVENGLIDSCTADILQSVEIPDVFPDIHHFNERYSTWLMYKKLAVDRWRHPADVSELNLPTPTEAEQLFISYLMINSYTDPRSLQRVLIFDSQLNETTQAFLKDPIFSQNLTFNIRDQSEQADVDVLLQINEETGKVIKNMQTDGRVTLEENTIQAFEPHNLTCLSKMEVIFDKQILRNDDSPKQDPVKECFVVDCTDMSNTEHDEVGRGSFQHSKNWAKSDDPEEKMNENSVKCITKNTDRENHDVPACLEVPFVSTLCPVKTKNADSSSQIFANEARIHQTLPYCNAESLRSESESDDIHQAKPFCSADVMEMESEYEHAFQLLKTQVDESSVEITPDSSTSDLTEKHRAPELDDLELPEKTDVLSGEEVSFLSIKHATQCQAEQNFLASDRKPNQTVQFESGKYLDSDSESSIYPELNYFSDEDSEDQTVVLSTGNLYRTENMQQQTERKMVGTVFDLPKKMTNEETESAKQHRNLETGSILGNQSFSSDSGHELVMISPSRWSQVTAGCDSHKDTQAFLADSDSQIMINRGKTDGVSECVVIGNSALTMPSNASHLSDSTSNPNSKNQAQHITLPFNCQESDNQPTDVVFSDELDSQETTLAGSEREFVTFLLSHIDLFEESRKESSTSDAHSASSSEPGKSSPGNSVEMAKIVFSRDVEDLDIKCAEDGSSLAVPQQMMPYSESVEFQPSCSQNIPSQNDPACDESAQQSNSPATPALFVDSNAVSHTSNKMEAPALTSNDLSKSLEKQNKEIFTAPTNTEQIPLKQENDSNNTTVPFLNVPSVSPSINLVQPETNRQDEFGSPNKPETVPVLYECCVTGIKHTQNSKSSSDLPDVQNTPNTISHRSNNMEALTINDLSNLIVSDEKACKERLSPERQHDDTLFPTNTEQISLSKLENNSKNESLLCLNPPSGSIKMDLVQHQTKMSEDLGSSSQQEKVPVLSEVCITDTLPAQQSNSSSDLPAVLNYLDTGIIVSHKSMDMQTSALSNTDLSGSNISCAELVQLHEERLSPQRQHEDTFIVPSNTEQAALSTEDSSNEETNGLNSLSVSSDFDLVQPEVKMGEDLESSNQPEEAPVLSDSCCFTGKNTSEQPNSSCCFSAFCGDISTANSANQMSEDMEIPAFPDNDLSDSIISGLNDVKVYEERHSPERQHNFFIVPSDPEQVSLSKQDNDSNSGSLSCLNPPFVSSGIDLVQPETIVGEYLGDRSQPVLSGSCVPSAVCSSTWSEICIGVETQEEMTTEHTDFSDLQKPQTQVNDCANHQSIEECSFHKSNKPLGPMESSVTDTVVDLMKQNFRTSNSKNMENSELTSQDEKVRENTEHAPNAQLQLLPLFNTISLNQDFLVLQEMVESLSSATQLQESQEDQLHTLESIKEESSEEEEEKSAGTDKDDCPTSAKTHQSSAHLINNSDACKAKKVKIKTEHFCVKYIRWSSTHLCHACPTKNY